MVLWTVLVYKVSSVYLQSVLFYWGWGIAANYYKAKQHEQAYPHDLKYIDEVHVTLWKRVLGFKIRNFIVDTLDSWHE